MEDDSSVIDYHQQKLTFTDPEKLDKVLYFYIVYFFSQFILSRFIFYLDEDKHFWDKLRESANVWKDQLRDAKFYPVYFSREREFADGFKLTLGEKRSAVIKTRRYDN